jgi:transglutaminase-like putative cysteine protease
LQNPPDGSFAPYLRSDRLVPTTGRIAEVSANLQKKGVSPYQQARVIYEYVTSVMKYDKTGKGWGRGDAVYACDIRRGNCTDFHSLFIALARARGIPARFIIGFVRDRFPVTIVGRSFIQAEYGSRWTLRRHGRIHRGTIIISAI